MSFYQDLQNLLLMHCNFALFYKKIKKKKREKEKKKELTKKQKKKSKNRCQMYSL